MTQKASAKQGWNLCCGSGSERIFYVFLITGYKGWDSLVNLNFWIFISFDPDLLYVQDPDP